MLETQKKWYVPALGTLGWHIGFWNLIGALGFTVSFPYSLDIYHSRRSPKLCGALGYSQSDAVIYQSSLSTFWGGWAFLIASLIQWYEAVSKYPVEK